jgi:hypothetical protein
MPSVFVRFRMCYAHSISKYHSIYVHILYALRARFANEDSHIGSTCASASASKRKAADMVDVHAREDL